MVLHILMADNRGAFSGVGELSGKEGALDARIESGRAQFHIASREIRLESGIDEELNGLIAQLLHRRDNLIGDCAGSGVHHHRSLVAHLNRDIASVTEQHGNLALNRKNMNLAIMGRWIGSAAGLRRTGGRFQFGGGRGFGACRIAQFIQQILIHRHRAAERTEKRNLILFGEFPRKGMPPPEVALHLILAASQNLFAVIAVILPGVRLLDAAPSV